MDNRPRPNTIRRHAGLWIGLTLALLALLLSSCWFGNRHREVSGRKFLELAKAPLGSAFDTRFIGATRTRAYLSAWSALPSSVGGGEDVYSVSLEELPREIVERIRAGENPWAR